MKKFFNIILFITLSQILSCEYNFPVEPIYSQRGEILSVELKSTIEVNNLKSILKSLNVEDNLISKLIYDVDFYKMVYTTLNHKGQIVKASGALFIPKGLNNLSLISIQHGTQTKRTNVGSINPYYSIEGIIGSSLGYFAIVPDYLGLGESDMFHPYHYAKTSADVVIDFIRATRSFSINNKIKLNGQVFLIGYSEGGYVTLAAQREIEKSYYNEINITASAPMAGAYDLYLTAQLILRNKYYDQPSFLAYLIYTYNEIYGWNKINEVFNSPFAEKISSLFDGTKTTLEINSALTNDLSLLFNQKFIKEFLDGNEKDFTYALRENSLINFIPVTPTRLYHGDADEYVPYENSLRAKEYFNLHGANVELITIKNGTHVSSGLPSIINAISWFDSLKEKRIIASSKYYMNVNNNYYK